MVKNRIQLQRESRRTKPGGENAGCGRRRTKSGLAARRPGPGRGSGKRLLGARPEVGRPGCPGTRDHSAKGLAFSVAQWLSSCHSGHPEALLTSGLGSLAEEASIGLAGRGASGPAGDTALSSSRRVRRSTCGWACCVHHELGGQPRRAGRWEPSPAHPATPAPWSLPTGPGRLLPPPNRWGSRGRLPSSPFPPGSGAQLAAAQRRGLWWPHLPG